MSFTAQHGGGASVPARACAGLLALASTGASVVRAVKTMTDDHYFFLRLSMAAAKATADAARDIEGSSVDRDGLQLPRLSVRVSGLGDTWFKGPLPGRSQAVRGSQP